MATYTETKAQYVAARNQLNAVVDSVTQNVDLGYGWVVKVKLAGNPPELKAYLEGPYTVLEVHDVPMSVLNTYVTIANKIEDWKNDLLPDFPSLP